MKMRENTIPPCAICKGYLWVCENHPGKVWDEAAAGGCVCGAGRPCVCNPLGRAMPGHVTVWGSMPGNN